jgi:transglutaminase-like putative cysteine protease
MTRRIPLAPIEGWLTLGLVTLLCLTMAWSIDDVALVLGNGGFTDFLAPMAIAGVLVGFIGAKVGWGRWLTYLIGAAFAALIVPLVVGLQLPMLPGATIYDAYQATATSLYQAVYELIVLDLSLTNEYGHYMLVLGLLVWATSMFASYAAFGHRRPLNAIVIVGLVLLINMALTNEDQLRYLVIYTLSALFLLVRFHVLDEQTEWLRRRIGDPASISGIYLRGGAIFIAVAVFGSLLLTNVARSAPLAGSWNGLSSGLIELSRSLQRFLPSGGNTRPIGNDFDPNGSSIRGNWNPNNDLVATIKTKVEDRTHYYWRATTFDEFNLNGWVTSEPERTEREAAEPLVDGTAEAADPRVSRMVEFTVTPASGSSSILLSPLVPTSVDQPTNVTLDGTDGYFGAIERRNDSPYTVTAQIRNEGNDPGEISVAALEAAGTDYPAEIERLYGADAVPDDAIPEGGMAEQLLAQLVDEAGPSADNPYDFAEYLRKRFTQSPSTGGLFTYVTDVNNLMEASCKGISKVECFATYRQGFCQYYATTMAIFLRDQGIPARIVEGYLPGDRSAQGVEVITGVSRHQWVEVYFPGYGWVMFDPTGGGVSRQTALPPGVPGMSPLPAPSFGVVPTRPDDTDFEPDDAGAGTTTRPGGPAGPLIAITILLAVIVGGLAFLAWQRGPRDGTTADHAYRTVTRLAARFGFGPRPNQTVYEYSGSLGEVLPIVRPELETVAQAKVETVYGRGVLSDERLQGLRAAERRLRLNLLRLAFRRGERRRRR